MTGSVVNLEEMYASIRPRYPELAGKTALVTGSGRGIGKGIALRLGREGMRIILTSNIPADVEASTQAFQRLGIAVLPLVADLALPEEIDRLFEQSAAAFGPLALLVNNAADLRRQRFLPDGLALLDTEIDVNIKAVYRCAFRAAEQMKAAGGGGSIIQISSVGGLRAHWRGLPYDLTKGAIDAMTRALAIDLAEYAIRVNAVAPGFTPNPDKNEFRFKELIPKYVPRIPLLRAGTPLDIGAAVAFLASDDASYVTGQVLYVDGGITAQLSPKDAEL